MTEITKEEIKVWIQDAVKTEKYQSNEPPEHKHNSFKGKCPNCETSLGVCADCKTIKEIDDDEDDEE